MKMFIPQSNFKTYEILRFFKISSLPSYSMQKTAPVQHEMVEYERSGHVKTLFFLFLLIPANWINQAFYEQRQRPEHEIFVVNCIAYQNYKCLAGLWNGAWAQHIDKNQHIKHFNIFINHHQQFIKPPRSVKFSRPRRKLVCHSLLQNNIAQNTKWGNSLWSFVLFFLFSFCFRIQFHLLFTWFFYGLIFYGSITQA